MTDHTSPPDSPSDPDPSADRITEIIARARELGDDELVEMWELLWRDARDCIPLAGSTGDDGAPDAAADTPPGAESVAQAADFVPVPGPGYRMRRDGWTAARQMAFIAALARTGCVRDAAREAGISSTSAYRYRKRDPGFADAWDAALVEARPALERSAYQRAVEGIDDPIVSGGKVIGTRKKYSDPLLKVLLDRDDVKRRQQLGGQPGVLTFEEWEGRWRFDRKGGKYREPDPEAVRRQIIAKLLDMKRKMGGDMEGGLPGS
jgi:hypothetical protein